MFFISISRQSINGPLRYSSLARLCQVNYISFVVERSSIVRVDTRRKQYFERSVGLISKTNAVCPNLLCFVNNKWHLAIHSIDEYENATNNVQFKTQYAFSESTE